MNDLISRLDWVLDPYEYVVVTTSPDGFPVVAFAAAFQLDYAHDELSMVHAYVHYIDAAKERRDAWVKFEVHSSGIVASYAEPMGEDIDYTAEKEHWGEYWEDMGGGEPVAQEDQEIFRRLGQALFSRCIDEDPEDGPFFVPMPAVADASAHCDGVLYGDRICHTGRFDFSLLMAPIAAVLPDFVQEFHLPWDLEPFRRARARVAKTTPPSYRFVLRFDPEDCAETDQPEAWFGRFCEHVGLTAIKVTLDKDENMIVGAAYSPWSLYEVDQALTVASRDLYSPVEVVDVSHGLTEQYCRGAYTYDEPDLRVLFKEMDETVRVQWSKRFSSLTEA